MEVESSSTVLSGAPGFSEEDWDILLTQIRDRTVVPIIGPELLDFSRDGKQASLDKRLVEVIRAKLAEQLGAPQSGDSIEQLAYGYLRTGRNRRDFSTLVYNALRQGGFSPPPAIRKLAEIRDFDLFVSTTFDRLMEDALIEARPGEDIRAIAHSIASEAVDLPPLPSQTGTTFVYQLFGKAQVLWDYVLTDDDMLSFVNKLRREGYRPVNLFSKLSKLNLLLLGCRFPDWLARFLLYTIHEERLFSEGASAIVADQEIKENQSLAVFLQRHRSCIFNQGNAICFIDELHRRWTERYGQQASTAVVRAPLVEGLASFQENSFFISYANEDLEPARRLAEALAKAGLPVWMDKSNLKSGDKYPELIYQYIEKSAFFIPIISKNTDDQERRFFRTEWNKAIAEAGKVHYEVNYLLPISIDGTTEKAAFIPPGFQGIHWHLCEYNDNFPGDFTNECLEQYRDRQRRQRRR